MFSSHGYPVTGQRVGPEWGRPLGRDCREVDLTRVFKTPSQIRMNIRMETPRKMMNYEVADA